VATKLHHKPAPRPVRVFRTDKQGLFGEIVKDVDGRFWKHHIEPRRDHGISNTVRLIRPISARSIVVSPRPYALSLSLNLVKLFDRAPELALLTAPEDDHTEREDNQER
jgi:hypothetical protein